MKKIKLLFLDDEKEDAINTAEVIKKLVFQEKEIQVEYEVFSSAEEIERMNTVLADILLFDCNMSSTNIVSSNGVLSNYGFELMKKYRRRNQRSKIIFYSSGFSYKGTKCYDFDHEEMMELINDIHVHRMVPKDHKEITKAIIDTIGEIDAVTRGVEDLLDDYSELGYFVLDNKEYSISQMISELQNGSDIGEAFKESINNTILLYLMKFEKDD